MPTFIKTILAACALALLNSPANAQSYDYVKEMRTATDLCLGFLYTGQLDAKALARNKMQPSNKKNTRWIKKIDNGPFKSSWVGGPLPHNSVEITFEVETNKRRVGQHDCEITLENVVGPTQGNAATPTERAIGEALFKRLTAKGFKRFNGKKYRIMFTNGKQVLFVYMNSKSYGLSPRDVYAKIGFTSPK